MKYLRLTLRSIDEEVRASDELRISMQVSDVELKLGGRMLLHTKLETMLDKLEVPK